ncbi:MULTISPECIES: TrlF family AAA-like ATPase [unclassified Pseudoalteromonas]|uniref:TrlF family AAA-like ATPase n=1 Tax=unclassified Pseudoalteromonas TaxID=194690 RepID=UPI00110AF927|nr:MULTISPECIES: DNA repair protein [unclassified Pseudoalteromonas]TMP47272.1 DNA repair protein [Pseudoalteromonas sp. S1650]TMP68825.1 DNA repair protein [Pseudoalteromonas sp. S1649]
MVDTFSKAKFWKCALQVNPASYTSYRGNEQSLTEDEYNKKLLEVCLEEGIKVIGLADHGNVDSVDKIRETLTSQGIVVFPGFEIASSEKVHLVCLFDEQETVKNLEHFLYELNIDTSNGTLPSPHSADFILNKIREKGGFVYAAHCTDDNGVLNQKLNNIWKNELLVAAQIPTTVQSLKEQGDQANYQILTNKDLAYKRTFPMVLINAKDVEDPETLRKENASCLIKMTEPSFSAFCQAFQDPESRVRLNSDIREQYYSRLESVSFIGGYLDGVEINYSEHLNTIIGGRGTGKSTLIECIRYALNLTPIGKQAREQHNKIVKFNLGTGQIRLEIKSATKHGQCYQITRRYGQSPVVSDMSGEISSFTPNDSLPEVEIFGQNEIHEIANDPSEQLKVVDRFLNREQIEQSSGIADIEDKLVNTGKEITALKEQVSEFESEVKKLELLEEDAKRFKQLGIDEQLKALPVLATEKTLFSAVKTEVIEFSDSLTELAKELPSAESITDEVIADFPDKELFVELKKLVTNLSKDAETLLAQISNKFSTGNVDIVSLEKRLEASVQEHELAIEKEFKKINPVEGKSGKQIGQEYSQLVKDVAQLKPSRSKLSEAQEKLSKHEAERKKHLTSLSEKMSIRSSKFEKGVKKLNKKLNGNIRVNYTAEGNRKSLIDKIVAFKIPGVASGKLQWIQTAQHFSPMLLAEKILEGRDAIVGQNWGCTDSVADKLEKISNAQVMEIEEFIVDDLVNIELNISDNVTPVFKELDSLSTGQQCTALLHLLLLDNRDPLLLDQPEDNLDNAFIADRIVMQVRKAKLTRQFIFATHNANIPIFGDAEWIGVLEANADGASLPNSNQGSIDQKSIQSLAAKILEGGKDAFNRRKEKYGF